MKKISVNKSDEASNIVEKLIETDSEVVVLIIPRFSSLSASLENFRLLKREAEALNKKIIIESVDNRVNDLAELADIEATNPFFSKSKRQFSDIIPKKAPVFSSSEIANKTAEKKIPAREMSRGSSVLQKKIGTKIKKTESVIDKYSIGESLDNLYKEEKERSIVHNYTEEEQPKITELSEEVSFSKKIPIKTIAALIVFGIIIYGAMTILPKANLNIVAKKMDWTYNDSVVTQKSAKADFKTVTIPNQSFTESKNAEMKFPATGKKQVETKAMGKILVYNSYSSDPQILVQNTRFVSPDGKLFLLAKQITVPGAKISEGKIIPSSIETNIVAEKTGADYNIGPVKLFSIPGFKGTAKYQAFYGESADSMKGGFVGEIAYPTASDLSSANQKIKETLQNTLKNTLLSQISNDFKVLDGASTFAISKQTNNEEVDKDGNFSIFADAQMTIIAFNESELLRTLNQKAQSDKGDTYYTKSYDLKYGVARMDTNTGRLSFPIDYKAVLSYKIDAENLKKEVIGKSEVDLKKSIFSLPGLDTANISLWPFWVKNVPTDLNKINIVID
jgi:hypothetical protein